MSKFAVVILPSAKRAYEALHALEELHGEDSVTVYETNVVQRDATGKLSVLKRDHDGPIGFGVGALVGGLVGLFGGPVGAAIGFTAGRLAGGACDYFHLDVSDEFLDVVVRDLAPGSFAVVAEIAEDWSAPLDTRMEELGGKVVREEREVFRDDLIEKRVSARRAALARYQAELARRRAERAVERAGKKTDAQEQKLVAEIEATQAKLVKSALKAEKHLDEVKQEFEAKLAALQAQAAAAPPEVKTRIDQRIAEIRSRSAWS